MGPNQPEELDGAVDPGMILQPPAHDDPYSAHGRVGGQVLGIVQDQDWIPFRINRKDGGHPPAPSVSGHVDLARVLEDVPRTEGLARLFARSGPVPVGRPVALRGAVPVDGEGLGVGLLQVLLRALL